MTELLLPPEQLLLASDRDQARETQLPADCLCQRLRAASEESAHPVLPAAPDNTLMRQDAHVRRPVQRE